MAELVDHIVEVAVVPTAVQPMSQVVVVPTRHQLQEVEVEVVQVLQMPTEIQEAVEEVALHILHMYQWDSVVGTEAVGVLDQPAAAVALLVALLLFLAPTRMLLIQAEVEVVEVLEAVEEVVLTNFAIMVITKEHLQDILVVAAPAVLDIHSRATAPPMVVVEAVVVAIEKLVPHLVRVDRAEAVAEHQVHLDARVVLLLPALAVLAQAVVGAVAPSILAVDPVGQESWSLP